MLQLNHPEQKPVFLSHGKDMLEIYEGPCHDILKSSSLVEGLDQRCCRNRRAAISYRPTLTIEYRVNLKKTRSLAMSEIQTMISYYLNLFFWFLFILLDLTSCLKKESSVLSFDIEVVSDSVCDHVICTARISSNMPVMTSRFSTSSNLARMEAASTTSGATTRLKQANYFVREQFRF